MSVSLRSTPAILSLILGVSCAVREDGHVAASSNASSSTSDSTEFAIKASGLDSLRLCDSLARVDRVFGIVRDTLILGEDGQLAWPGRRVLVDSNSWLLFETSWTDSVRVSRISTNSRRFVTPRGYRVGMTMRELLTKDTSLSVQFEEGIPVIYVRAESIAFLLEESAASRFGARFRTTGDGPTSVEPTDLTAILVVSASCSK